MRTSKGIFLFFTTIAIIGLFVSSLNYYVDPNCEYRCKEINLNRVSLNPYYQMAQKITAMQSAEIIEQVVVGSSRAQTTSPLWLEKITGLNTLNLAIAAADLNSNLVFVKMANSQKTLKQIIWFADYFELIGSRTNQRLQKMPALSKWVADANLPSQSILQKIRSPFGIFDHKVLEASIGILAGKHRVVLNKGAGSDIDYQKCVSDDFKGTRSFERMKNEVDVIYLNYTSRVLPPLQSEDLWSKFVGEVKQLSSEGIKVYIIINPYHPEFYRRLKIEYPEIFKRHADWANRLMKLSEVGTNIVVANYYSQGIPGDDAGPQLWDDGSHFNCLGSIRMLEPLLKQ